MLCRAVVIMSFEWNASRRGVSFIRPLKKRRKTVESRHVIESESRANTVGSMRTLFLEDRCQSHRACAHAVAKMFDESSASAA